MVNFFPNNSAVHISDGIIEEIQRERNTTFLTVVYMEQINNRRVEQAIRMTVSNRTTIFDEDGGTISANDLEVGMIIHAVVSSIMTRSIPPQANAFLIRVLQRPISEQVMEGRILEINQENRSFTTIRNGNPSSIIRFNVPENVEIFNRNGRRIDFSRLNPGMRVRVRHASFMTASIPPQTTAFEIRIL